MSSLNLVRQIQEFADSPEDRVTSANFLVRHFLPAYGLVRRHLQWRQPPSVVATDVIGYIDNLAIETPIDVPEMQDLIARRGGNPATPTFVKIISSRLVEKDMAGIQLRRDWWNNDPSAYDGTARVSFSFQDLITSWADPSQRVSASICRASNRMARNQLSVRIPSERQPVQRTVC